MDNLYNLENIPENIKNEVERAHRSILPILNNVDEIEEYNSLKVLNAFHKYNLSEIHFNETTGYGYNDIGRDTLELIYKEIFVAEDALVRTQFISGTHALTVTLFGLLRPNDTLLSISGTPYDTLHEVIGIKENPSSLKSYNINYLEIDLVNDDFDYDKIENCLKNNKIKVIEIQRSKGYSTRKSISIEKIEKVIKFIKNINKEIIIMVDNCYCEFVTKKEPNEVGADITVGSLIKNLGGAIAPNGAYVVGSKKLINLVAERLTAPGEGKEVGPTLGVNKRLIQGLFFAPSVVASSLKTAILTSKVMEDRGYLVEPSYNENRVDIVQNIIFNDKEKLIKFCKGVQKASPVDSFATPEPWEMPGYDDLVIMASGSFTSGSSIELSCDGPIREPYIAYMQGSVTYNYGKLGLMISLSVMDS